MAETAPATRADGNGDVNRPPGTTTHRAVVLESYSRPPVLRMVPTPQPAPGQVLVEVLAAPVAAYQKRVLAGTQGNPTLPSIPGTSGVGRVLAVGSDAAHLRPGDLVLLDPSLRARDDGPTTRILTLAGHLHMRPDLAERDAAWRDGCWAERALVPVENAVVVRGGGGGDGGESAWLTPARLAVVQVMSVAYGGWSAAGLRAGQTAVVAYGTGGFGGAAVETALAIGAGRVVVVGRDLERLTAALTEIAATALGPKEKVGVAAGGRLVPCVVVGEAEADAASLTAAIDGDGFADVFLDISPPSAASSAAALLKAAVRVLRPRGTLVLMGGITTDVAIPYAEVMLKDIVVRGQFMCDREDYHRLVALVTSGRLPLDRWTVREYPLEAFAEATEFASTASASTRVVLVPGLNSNTLN